KILVILLSCLELLLPFLRSLTLPARRVLEPRSPGLRRLLGLRLFDRRRLGPVGPAALRLVRHPFAALCGHGRRLGVRGLALGPLDRSGLALRWGGRRGGCGLGFRGLG